MISTTLRQFQPLLDLAHPESIRLYTDRPVSTLKEVSALRGDVFLQMRLRSGDLQLADDVHAFSSRGVSGKFSVLDSYGSSIVEMTTRRVDSRVPYPRNIRTRFSGNRIPRAAFSGEPKPKYTSVPRTDIGPSSTFLIGLVNENPIFVEYMRLNAEATMAQVELLLMGGGQVLDRDFKMMHRVPAELGVHALRNSRLEIAHTDPFKGVLENLMHALLDPKLSLTILRSVAKRVSLVIAQKRPADKNDLGIYAEQIVKALEVEQESEVRQALLSVFHGSRLAYCGPLMRALSPKQWQRLEVLEESWARRDDTSSNFISNLRLHGGQIRFFVGDQPLN